jgi:hypothetical protein
VIQPYLAKIDALVATGWLPGTEGQGVADVLFGDCEFTGKLARTWFIWILKNFILKIGVSIIRCIKTKLQ